MSNRRVNLEMPAELYAECEQRAKPLHLNDWIRRELAAAVGRPQLADLMLGRGRPKKTAAESSDSTAAIQLP